MDRQPDDETAVNFRDIQFRRALEVIAGLYEGTSAEKLYNDAIGCFDSLIEISRNTDLTVDFARRHNLDNKYLVDGANFVISRMHFNPESNYYITLGLSRNVSSAEIRDRWKKLMLLYHPDLQEGDESWVSERAKKVNEAYSILKDSGQRQAFDRKLQDRILQLKPMVRPGKMEKDLRPGSRKKAIFSPEWERKKKSIPKIIVGTYIIAALGFLGHIYIQNSADQLESSLSGRDGLAAGPHLKVVAGDENNVSSGPGGNSGSKGHMHTGETAPEPIPDIEPGQEKMKADPPGVVEQLTQGKMPSAPDGPAKKSLPKKGKTPGRDFNSSDISAVKEAPLPGPVTAGPGANPRARVQESSPAAGTTLPVEVSGAELSEKPEASVSPVPVPAISPQQMQPAETGITREEVEQFIKLYSSSYLKGDLNSFMALFSGSVLENDRLRYAELREGYKITFSEKIDFYRLKTLKIEVNGQSADVSAVYNLRRYASDKGRWMHYSGRIRWNVAREGTELKITGIHHGQ
jgi:curved DNA-binding protein CbpA